MRVVDRRSFLARMGMGLSVLPTLFVEHPRARAATSPRRLICVALTGGHVAASWRPRAGRLSDRPLPTSLSPLSPHADRLLILPALANPAVPSCAATCAAGYLSLWNGLDGSAAGAGGATVDQLIGRHLVGSPGGLPASGTRATLPLAVRAGVGPTAPVEDRRAFWSAPGAPVEPIGDPQAAYHELFGRPAATAETQRLLARGKSILDYLDGNLKSFARRLGNEDRQRIEKHAASVRSLETALATPACSSASGFTSPALDLRDPRAYVRAFDLHMRVAVMALSCDVTPVVTLQLSGATGADVDVGFLAGDRAPKRLWSDVVAGDVTWHRRLDDWLMERLVGLLGDLESTTDPLTIRTLGQDTIVVWGNATRAARGSGAVGSVMIAARHHFGTGRCLDDPGLTLPTLHAELATAFALPSHPFGAGAQSLR